MDFLTFTGTNPFTGLDGCGIVREFDSNRRPQWVRGRFSTDKSWHWYDIEQCAIQFAYAQELSPYVGPKVGANVQMPSDNVRIRRVKDDAIVGTELFCGSGRIASSCERNGIVMNRLDWLLDSGPRTWNVDFAKMSDGAVKALFGVDYLHASPDCRTYSQLTASINQRTMETNFLGKTDDAYHANAILLKLFKCLELALRDNPKLIFTIENPEATFDLHPLVRQMCKPRKEGGLGASVVRFSFCAFRERVQKNTVLITTVLPSSLRWKMTSSTARAKASATLANACMRACPSAMRWLATSASVSSRRVTRLRRSPHFRRCSQIL